MKELICIVCPRGCHLQVDEKNDYAVTGNACARGAAYGKAELTNPTRVLTSTVKVEGAMHRRCPVKTDAPVPKGKLFELVKLLDDVTLCAPVKVGQVIIENAADTGANIVSARTLDAVMKNG